jgi:NAD(P)H-dependent FMN reductase
LYVGYRRRICLGPRQQRGFPAAVERFRSHVAAADALILAAPEYNFSVSGVLKNALEWLSRPPNPPAFGKPCAMFGASVSPLGTARGQFHLRHICVSLNMTPVNAPHVDITNAKTKFDAESRLIALGCSSRSSIGRLPGTAARAAAARCHSGSYRVASC